ncbi:MAG: phycocyanin alpha phycocyanobilin lyase [Dehalococcoidia bacterium]|nr:MAG: phycocyanin alpha phycocyanobilin lyase [Dehalococcoidia bacterium]
MSLDTLLPKLEDPQHPPSATDLLALNHLEGDEHERFLSVWRSLSIQRRRDIIDLLADMAEDNAELDFGAVFMTGLLDDDVQVRAQSIKALWEYEDDRLVEVLLRLLRDPEAMVRAEAALGLGRYLLRVELSGEDEQLARDVEAALRAKIDDESELVEVRGRALEAVGVRSEPWVHDAIEEAYASGDRRLSISAVHAMGRSADLAWLPIVFDEMDSDDAEMRFEAAMAAGSLGDERAISKLGELSLDADAEVQEAAITALGQVGGPAAREALLNIASGQSDPRVLEAVRDALAEADFIEDPLGFRMYLDRSVAEDAEEEDDE